MCLAIPGQILVDRRTRRTVLRGVDVAGVRRNVNIGLSMRGRGVRIGEWVLIHVGFAISKVDENEAEATRRMLEGMGADYSGSSRS